MTKLGQSRSALTKRPRQIVEQFVYREGPRTKSLLRGVSDDYLERTTHILRTEKRRAGRSIGGLHQQPMNFPYDIWVFVGQHAADHHHMVDRQHLVPDKPRLLFRCDI